MKTKRICLGLQGGRLLNNARFTFISARLPLTWLSNGFRNSLRRVDRAGEEAGKAGAAAT